MVFNDLSSYQFSASLERFPFIRSQAGLPQDATPSSNRHLSMAWNNSSLGSGGGIFGKFNVTAPLADF
jgi:hypothetical protein